MGNIGSAMEMASTGLVVMGAAVPLKMMKNLSDSMATTKKRSVKRKKKVKGRRKK